jgi:hypothetical protein
LNGHSDLNAGAVIASSEIIARIRPCAINHGGMLDAHAGRFQLCRVDAERIGADLAPLVSLADLGGLKDAELMVGKNPLSNHAQKIDLPYLQGKGVKVRTEKVYK